MPNTDSRAKFKRNLLIGFGISLTLLIISSVASFTSIQNLNNSAELVDHTNTVLQKLEEVISVLKDGETGQRGYLLTNDESYVRRYDYVYDSTLHLINDIKLMTSDNDPQQVDCRQLQEVAILRLRTLQSIVDNKRKTGNLDLAAMETGRQYMVTARQLVTAMKMREQQLLRERTATMDTFARYTPILIVVAAVLAVLITIVFFARVNTDFERRIILQNELQDKDEEITRRIQIISQIANTVSSGDYSVRASDSGRDGLGELSGALNKMAESLQYSFGLLSDKEWLQSGIAGLNEKMLGEYDITLLTHHVLRQIVDYVDCEAGVFYRVESDEQLHFVNGIGIARESIKEIIEPGEGIVGECVRTGKLVYLKDVPESQVVISHALGAIKTSQVIALPVFFERKLVGVIELAGLREFKEKALEFLNAATHNIGTVLNSVENRRKLQELLEETQSQAEELQAQHAEMENINAELEAQTEKLQASEEELKVQQEELLEANQELEEKARLLEERNMLIYERNQEIQKKAEELALSTKYKSEFLANMSHELRTPLNSILLLSRLMAENNANNLNTEQIEYAQVINSSGQGLLSLIDEILDLSKIEAGKMDLLYADVQIQEIVNDMRSLFEPIAHDKGVELQIQIADKVQGMIETDKTRLEQILKNLLSNALKFTAKGYVRLTVYTPEKEEGKIVFSVKDTGIGISKEKQQLVFEAFQQADGSTRRKYGGTGLGLSISRELARLLNGVIQLQSEPEAGSEFTLMIPVSKHAAAAVQQQQQQKDEQITEAVLPGQKPQTERYTTDIIPPPIPDDRDSITEKDKVILIVEDDTAFARALLNYTRQRKYKGVVTVRGDEATALARRFKPAGILLDIQLPVKDGWEVLEELKTNVHTRHIPVHMMSVLENRNKSLSKGAVDFINKPVALEQMDDVFRKIEYVLNYNPRKVLIVEENTMHAKALAHFLEMYKVNTEIRDNVNEGIKTLKNNAVNCVILDMGIPTQKSYETLEEVKKEPGLENIPVIIFTGKSLSRAEELRIKQYADSIVIKTAHSYQRILDEVSLFLHLVEEKKETKDTLPPNKNLGVLRDVLKGKKVLIADDDIRNIFSLTKSLEAFEMQVISAVDGKDALKQLEANPDIDIILMDMMMPEMDGYESTRRIKADTRFKRLPVIAVTAKAMTGDREKCISAGASDYITKPVDVDQLLSLLRVWLYDSIN